MAATVIAVANKVIKNGRPLTASKTRISPAIRTVRKLRIMASFPPLDLLGLFGLDKIPIWHWPDSRIVCTD